MSASIYDELLSNLIDGLNTVKQDSFLQSWVDVQQWPAEALNIFLRLGLIIPTADARTIECPGCDRHCFMDVLTIDKKSPAFIVCEDSDMQAQTGRISIPQEKLKQWKTSINQFVRIIANLLDLKISQSQSTSENKINLGMLKGSKGRRWISLITQPLSIEINGYIVPLNEILFFENDQLKIDRPRIDDLVNRDSKKESHRHESATNKREKQKKKTAVRHQDWQDEYSLLKKEHPDKSKSWCARQIAKKPIGQKRDAETIRHNLK